MVYDEGFNIDTEHWTFFAFSKYSPTIAKNGKTKYNSNCYSTCVGWYSNKDSSLWGCYYAYKKGVNKESVFSVNGNNEIQILEPVELTRKHMENEKKKKEELKDSPSDDDVKGIKDEKEKKKDEIKSTITEMLGLENETEADKNNNNYSLNVNPMTSFLDLNIKENLQTTMRLSSTFSNHMAYIGRLNRIKKNWSADVHTNFQHMTISDLNKYAGIPKSFNRVRFREKEDSDITLNNDNKVSEYPDNFSWKEYLREAGSQGNCGSCYAYSTTRMTEARLLIHYDHKEKLSVQHNLDCCFYNQGCSGGYPFLLMKFANQFEMIPEDCKPYIEMNGKCNDSCDKSKLDFIFKLENYRYVGGSYGQCSEESMMKELYHNGPVVVSFEPDYNFMLYRSGIYHSISDESWKKAGVEKPEWQKVDHSVLLVGWGVDSSTKEKYWIIQNTWGPYWGEKGYFRMRRGVDELGIESICEAADPVIIDNKTQKRLEKQEYKKLTEKNNQKEVKNDQTENTHESLFSFLT